MNIQASRIAQAAVLTAAVLLLLAPFAGKAFHIDDPMYIWAARQILDSPADFYGFQVNWEGYMAPMAEVMQNPPGVSYFIAAASTVAGFGEYGLHIAFLIPALAAAFGTLALARRFTASPLLASLVAIATPVFAVSASTVMSDVLMVAFWVWSIETWVSGTDKGDHRRLAIAATLAGLGILTKYNAVSLFPLLAAYSLMKRRPGHLLWLLFPALMLLGFEAATAEMYGRGLFSKAAAYSSMIKGLLATGAAEKGFTGLLFAGGSFLPVLFFLPFIRNFKVYAAVILFASVALIVLLLSGGVGGMRVYREGGLDWAFMAHAIVFSAAGGGLLAIAVSDLLRERDPKAVLLFLWVAGTFVFSGFVNWTTNGRTLLPMAPAFGILIARATGARRAGFSSWRLLPLLPAFLVALLVSAADFSLANSAREAARTLLTRYSQQNSASALWFQGHWGLQYYVEAWGGRVIDWRSTVLKRGDLVVIPLNNYDLVLPLERLSLADKLSLPLMSGASTMHPSAGSSFYASIRNPLPFAFCLDAGEDYFIMRVREDIDLPALLPGAISKARRGPDR